VTAEQFTQSQVENMRAGSPMRGRCYLFLAALLLLSLSDDHQVLMVHGLAQPTAGAAATVGAAAVVTNRRAALFSAAAGIATAVAVVGQVQQKESLVPPLFTPPAAWAYERRDVGDETRSAESAAYNIQAYETNNRLEREGMKLETQAEQKASLTAALAEYSYAPTTTSTNKKDGRGSSSSTKSSRSSSTSSDKKVNK
jgi:hypothetical protein